MLVSRASLAVARWSTVLLCCLLPSIAAYPQAINTSAAQLAPRVTSFYLRILPLGASITYGTGSSQGNGYRKFLRDQLRFMGYNVNMVGSKVPGNLANLRCRHS